MTQVNGNSIAARILEALEVYGLDATYARIFVAKPKYDGAGNMVGNYQDAAACI